MMIGSRAVLCLVLSVRLMSERYDRELDLVRREPMT